MEKESGFIVVDFNLIFTSFIFPFRGKYRGEGWLQRDWQMSGIMVHNMKLPKNMLREKNCVQKCVVKACERRCFRYKWETDYENPLHHPKMTDLGL